MLGALAMMGVNAGMNSALKKNAAPDASQTTANTKPPSALQSFGADFAGSMAESAGSGLGGGVGGGLGGGVGSLIQDRIKGSPGEQARDFMDQAYPGTNVAERIGSNAASSVGGQATASRTAATVAKINADATKYSADKQLEGKKIEHGIEGNSPVVARQLAKLESEIRKTTAEGSKALTDAQEAHYKSQFWDLYINAETALPIHKVPFSQASDKGLKAAADWAYRTSGLKGTYEWLKGERSFMGNPILKNNAAGNGSRVDRSGTIGRQKIYNNRTRRGAERSRR